MKRIIVYVCALMLAVGMSAQVDHFTKFTVVSWNIGHFSLGQSGDTKLTHLMLPFYRYSYRQLFNGINADIMALVEYNPLMVNATEDKAEVVAREAILSNYTNAQVGPKYSYNCNAIFSNGFKVIATDTVSFSQMAQHRYYLVSTMLIDGDTVKFVSTHLDWNQGEHGAEYRAVQIDEIIKAFENDRYVIMCGDWNVEASSEYDAFAKAGYSMANHAYMGDLLTYPAGAKPRKPLDNIIAKGFAVGKVTVQNEPMLSDHCLLQAELTKLPR